MAVETPFLSWDAERLCCHTLSCRAVCMTNQHTCFHRKHLTRWAICFHSREKKKKKKKAALSPLLPFPASARTPSLPPAPPAPAPLPWKPSGSARISPPPPPLAVLQYRGEADHGESGQQLAAAPGDGRLPLLEALRRLRGQDRGPLSALCHGQLLA